LNELLYTPVSLIIERGVAMNVVRLVKKAKKGNKNALLKLILVEKDAYYRLAFTYMGNSHDAMDAVEDMIVKLYENIHQLKNEKAFYSWSKTILVNRCKTILRKSSDFQYMEQEQINEQDHHNPHIRTDHQLNITEMLSKVNEHQKEALQLKYFHDFDYQTIAEMTNVSIGTVKSRIFQGLKKLRDYYGGEHGE